VKAKKRPDYVDEPIMIRKGSKCVAFTDKPRTPRTRKGWKLVGTASKSDHLLSLMRVMFVRVYESECRRFQIQGCREYEGRYPSGHPRYSTYYKLFDGERQVKSGTLKEMMDFAEGMKCKNKAASKRH